MEGNGGNGSQGKWGSGWGDHHGHGGGGRHAGMGSGGGSHGMAPVAMTGTVEKKENSFCEKTPGPNFRICKKVQWYFREFI